MKRGAQDLRDTRLFPRVPTCISVTDRSRKKTSASSIKATAFHLFARERRDEIFFSTWSGRPTNWPEVIDNSGRRFRSAMLSA